tara:strand:- start:725 stop:877 length:153 start_codon:yes stop_codon:yes gene_type:complete
MADYIDIKGVKVENIASDPSNPIEGDVWYNSASGVLKFYDGTSVKTVTAS